MTERSANTHTLAEWGAGGGWDAAVDQRQDTPSSFGSIPSSRSCPPSALPRLLAKPSVSVCDESPTLVAELDLFFFRTRCFARGAVARTRRERFDTAGDSPTAQIISCMDEKPGGDHLPNHPSRSNRSCVISGGGDGGGCSGWKVKLLVCVTQPLQRRTVASSRFISPAASSSSHL